MHSPTLLIKISKCKFCATRGHPLYCLYFKVILLRGYVNYYLLFWKLQSYWLYFCAMLILVVVLMLVKFHFLCCTRSIITCGSYYYFYIYHRLLSNLALKMLENYFDQILGKNYYMRWSSMSCPMQIMKSALSIGLVISYHMLLLSASWAWYQMYFNMA